MGSAAFHFVRCELKVRSTSRDLNHLIESQSDDTVLGDMSHGCQTGIAIYSKLTVGRPETPWYLVRPIKIRANP